jgi:hypothetical protein
MFLGNRLLAFTTPINACRDDEGLPPGKIGEAFQ